MPYINYDGREIYFEIIKSKRKTLGIKVGLEEGVVVRAPKNARKSDIVEAIKENSKWIAKKLDKLEEVEPLPPPKSFENGEELLYLGQSYPLEIIRDEANKINKEIEIYLKKGKFYICINSCRNKSGVENKESEREKIKRYLEKWYRKEASKVIGERVDLYSKELGLFPNNVRIKKQKKRWGSCSNMDNLNFNWKLIMAPLKIIDYVIIHELIHLKHPNHSDVFWEETRKIFPDYKKCQEWLRVYGRTLTF